MNCILNKLKSFFKFLITGKINTKCKNEFYHEFNKINNKTEQIKNIEIFNKMQL